MRYIFQINRECDLTDVSSGVFPDRTPVVVPVDRLETFKSHYFRTILIPFLWCFFLLPFISSCVDEIAVSKDETISIVVKAEMGSIGGTGLDNEVNNFRVMVFDSDKKIIVLNQLFSGITQEGDNSFNITFGVKAGTYDFVFVANEPSSMKMSLELVYNYTDLENIRFSCEAFNNDDAIPMVNIGITNRKIDVTTNNLGADPIKLSRLGVRLDLTFETEIDPNDLDFDGFTLNELAKTVPLLRDADVSDVVTPGRDIDKNKIEPYFTKMPDDGSMPKWQYHNERTIIPAKWFDNSADLDKAVQLTLQLTGGPFASPPTFPLRIFSAGEDGRTENDYTLPRNSYLTCRVTLKKDKTLDLEMQVEDWTTKSEEGELAPIRILNVSQTEATITDFNGVRISFQSNMPRVKVLRTLAYSSNGDYTTNNVFCELALETYQEGSGKSGRFYYDSGTGSGQMDILCQKEYGPGSYVYKIILSAENNDGTNALQRIITINVNQYGYRPSMAYSGTWYESYIGAFFRNDEIGERIITGQLWGSYTVEIEDGTDWLVISPTPSFDPNAGTDSPGNPELYPVEEDASPYDNKSSNGGIKGQERIYFRIGTKSRNTGAPRYGKIKVVTARDIVYLYVRQGEEPDYIQEGRSASVRFSPYNLTYPDYEANNTAFTNLSQNGGEFVKYPTQAGAFFHFVDPIGSGLERRAYHPASPNEYSTDDWSNPNVGIPAPPLWNGVTDPYNVLETCPKNYNLGSGNVYNYRRPTDGPTDKIAYNADLNKIFGYVYQYDESYTNKTLLETLMGYNVNVFADNFQLSTETIPLTVPDQFITASDDPIIYQGDLEKSEFRQSLFSDPQTGDNAQYSIWEHGGKRRVVDIIDRYTGVNYHPDFREGFYADGFFDRRPIKKINDKICAVSVADARIAFRGILVVNSSNNKSVFFPSAGRREAALNGTLKYQGETGYYWSSSASPWIPLNRSGGWSMDFSYYGAEGGTSQVAHFGQPIRCVVDE